MVNDNDNTTEITVNLYTKLKDSKEILMNFDVIITDITTPKPYDQHTLDTEPLGGTESSVIRVAEGLAKKGYRVGVFEHNLESISMGEGAYYLPLSELSNVRSCHAFVSLRSAFGVDMFPMATKVSWHEDVPNKTMNDLMPTFMKHNVTVVGASRWHKRQIQEQFKIGLNVGDMIPRVVSIYNPVPDELYDIPRDLKIGYENNVMVWAASPHKGLDRAIKIFQKCREAISDQLELRVFNPGYLVTDIQRVPGVVVYGAVPCKTLWEQLGSSLCLFYPTSFEETFGCIAAESNAMHCPVATFPVAALRESVNNTFAENQDEQDFIKLVEKWYNGERPEVTTKKEFKTSQIVYEWEKVLGLI